MSRQRVASTFAAALLSAIIFANTASNAAAAPLLARGHAAPAMVRTAHHGDLDLASVGGRHRLSRRVRGAVRSLCGVKLASPPPGAIVQRECAASAWNARPQIDATVEARSFAALR